MRAGAAWAGTVVIALLSAACGHGAAPAPADGAAVGIADALAAPAGTTLRVTGRFAGWAGGCTGGPPRTRSDWMLVDADGRCLYVSGPVPAGIAAPPASTSSGTAVTVSGRREATPDGRPYLLHTR